MTAFRLPRAVGVAGALAGVLVLTAGCGSTSSPKSTPAVSTPISSIQEVIPATTTVPTPTTPTTTPTAASTCALKQGGDLILWMKVPGVPDQAQVIGDVDYGLCKTTVDSLAQTSPLGPGYCSALATVASNPGYDETATPAPRPKNIIAEVGGSC